MKVEIKGNEIVLTLPFDKKGKASKSAKSMVHATTGGNVETEVDAGNGKKMKIGVNVYTSN